VQICPVGALTASTYRFKARPWDLETTESTCQGCSVGCRISIDSSRDQVQRFNGVDIDPVNWGWLCDKGRFGSGALSSDARLTEPLVREGDALRPARWSDALSRATDALRRATPASIGVIGGARLTNEDAYAWAKLFKGVLRTDNVDAQLGDGLDAAAVLGLPRATIDEVCAPGGTVLVLGPDVKEELPVLFLRLRHAAENDRVTLVEVAPRSSGLTSLCRVSVHPQPGETAAVVQAILGTDPVDRAIGGVDADRLEAARLALVDARGPLTVVVGRASVAESADMPLAAASAVLAARPDTTFLPALRRANVLGALDMGLAPGLLPGRVALDDARGWFSSRWPGVPQQRGLDTAGILQAAADGRLDVLVLLGADPLADFPDRDLAERALAGAGTILAVDTFLNESSRRAHVVLAAAGFAEKAGTTTNLEGRVSVLSQRVTPVGTTRPDWMLASELGARLGTDLGYTSFTDVLVELSAVAPSHLGLDVRLGEGAPDGVLVPLEGLGSIEGLPAPVRATPVDVPSVPAAAGDRLRLLATRRLYDLGTLVQAAPVLRDLAPGSGVRLNPADAHRLGLADGARVTVRSARSALTVTLSVDPGVPAGAAAMVVNQADGRVSDLLDGAVVTDVAIEVAS
ncbi:MAG: hypothetical protein FGM58_01500, partial [Acidimicrobiia bacterium]|nr:hypothetical protein [Acidimicrobiia bacterium]